jgi:hypothetical protein
MVGDQRGGAGFERIVLLLALGALAIALAFSEFARWRDKDALTRTAKSFESDLAAARSDARAALSAVIPPEVVGAASPSVYLIVANGAPKGTAFVVDREQGVLATTGHMRGLLPIGEEGADVHLINRSLDRGIPIIAVRPHAGYAAFRALVEDYQPIRKESSIYAPSALPLRDIAFDAALITVNPIDPDTGENRLGPDMKIAPEEKLLALAPGSPIAVIGYPYDTLDDTITATVATPRAERGAIAAMIAPIDDVTETKDPVTANLLVHRLATAGGNSGSPIVDAAGEVVGLHSHGVESISSNADGAAQRAEAIYDLLSPEREAMRLKDIFIPAWSRTLTRWARGADVMAWSFYKEYHEPGEDPPRLVGEIDYDAPTPFAKKIAKMAFGDAVAERRVEAPDGAVVETAGGAAEKAFFTIKEAGQFADMWVTVDRSRETVLFAYDYSLRSRSASCRLTTYWRVRGATRLEVQRARSSFELHLPATGGGGEDYQLVFRRDAECDRMSQTFMVGQIDWAAPAAAAQTALAAQADDFAAENKGFGKFAVTARTKVETFVTCDLFGRTHADRCAKPEYLEIEALRE